MNLKVAGKIQAHKEVYLTRLNENAEFTANVQGSLISFRLTIEPFTPGSTTQEATWLYVANTIVIALRGWLKDVGVSSTLPAKFGVLEDKNCYFEVVTQPVGADRILVSFFILVDE